MNNIEKRKLNARIVYPLIAFVCFKIDECKREHLERCNHANTINKTKIELSEKSI